MNISREAGNRATEERAYQKLEDAYIRQGFSKAHRLLQREFEHHQPLVPSDVSKAAEYRERHLKIVKEVIGPTEVAAEPGTYNIHGNFYRPFCEF